VEPTLRFPRRNVSRRPSVATNPSVAGDVRGAVVEEILPFTNQRSSVSIKA
jgi:hypothetical protein